MSKSAFKRVRHKALKGTSAEEYRLKWGVPDWRLPNLYPTKDDALSLDAWKWEFLRRDEIYRRAYEQKKRHAPVSFCMKEWIEPWEKVVPKFHRAPCGPIQFNAESTNDMAWAYLALKDNIGFTGSIPFNIEMSQSLGPQIKIIKKYYNKHKWSDDEAKPRKPRRRTRALLLRVLDAANERVSVSDMIDVFHADAPVSEKSMRGTIAFAKQYWVRF